jgi:four helix bundle protein
LKITSKFPKEELFGLTSQMRRAASSIPVNIAEGSMRQSEKEYRQFLYVARGSMAEIEVWIMMAKDLDYINENEYSSLSQKCDEIGKLLNGLIKSL